MARINGVKVIDMKDGEVTKIAYEGAEYASVRGPAKKGDIAFVINGWGSQVEGQYFPVIQEEHSFYTDYESGDLVYISGAVCEASTDISDVELFRKASDPIEGPVQVGDKIRIVNRDPIECRYDNGDVLTVVHAWRDGDALAHLIGYSNVFVLQEEYEIIERPTESESKFAVGDIAKVVGVTRFNDIKTGTIVGITEDIDEDGEFQIETLGGANFDYDFAIPTSLEKASEEEAEKAQKEAKWAKIGRKVDEYKEGDIVRVTVDHARSSRNRKGDIGYVVAANVIDGSWFEVQVEARDVPQANGSYHKPDSIELITPVEQRFDK